MPLPGPQMWPCPAAPGSRTCTDSCIANGRYCAKVGPKQGLRFSTRRGTVEVVGLVISTDRLSAVLPQNAQALSGPWIADDNGAQIPSLLGPINGKKVE